MRLALIKASVCYLEEEIQVHRIREKPTSSEYEEFGASLLGLETALKLVWSLPSQVLERQMHLRLHFQIPRHFLLYQKSQRQVDLVHYAHRL